MAGLDPAIHLYEEDGCAGPGCAKASPGTSVSGRRSFSEDGKPAHDALIGSSPRMTKKAA
jgi:hypothetical protein